MTKMGKLIEAAHRFIPSDPVIPAVSTEELIRIILDAADNPPKKEPPRGAA